MLTNKLIVNVKPASKAFKLSDSGGLFLFVHTNGSKYWRLKYRYAGKERLLALGIYPHISLADARERRDAAKKLLANNIDPSAVKQTQKLEAKLRSANSFEAIANEWIKKQSVKWVPKNTERNKSMLKRYVYPHIGDKPIAQITAAELLSTIQRMEKLGIIETAHRALQVCGQIFRYGIATGRAQVDLSTVLKGALTPVVETHHASITDPKQVGALLRAIEDYQGSFLTRYALSLAPLLFVRPGELRHAEWKEIDFDAAEWRIPAIKMKMNGVHIVPLSLQAIRILKNVYELTGHGKYVFPGVRTTERPMSENTLNGALRRLGYTKDQMTSHGFRSMASTMLHEQGWPHEAIERQLAHSERNKVSAAYNYAEHLPKRREMMQAWADYLDDLISYKKITSLKRVKLL